MILAEPIEPTKAHAMVQYALATGRLVKPDRCESCPGGVRVVGHHKDYRKPLDLDWLCDSCHLKRHRPFIIPYCENCGRAVMHEKFCVPSSKYQCGLCLRTGHNRIRCPRPGALREACETLRTEQFHARIETINSLLVAAKQSALPIDADAAAFVEAFESAARSLTYYGNRGNPLAEARTLARYELASLGNSLLRSAHVDPDALEAA